MCNIYIIYEFKAGPWWFKQLWDKKKSLSQTNILHASVISIFGVEFNCKDECQQANFVVRKIVVHSGIETATLESQSFPNTNWAISGDTKSEN